MKRTTVSYPINHIQQLKKQLIVWGAQHREVIALDSNNQEKKDGIEFILAVDALTSIQTDDVSQAIEYQTQLRDWCFGFISYEVKNQLMQIKSHNASQMNFPEIVFFQPKKLIQIKENEIHFHYLGCCDDEIELDYKEICEQSIEKTNTTSIQLQARTSQEEYEKQFQQAKKHIERGDVYELNYCIEFHAENQHFEPQHFFNQLNESTRAPFASFVKWNKQFALCASPERFIQHQNRKIYMQPIKGTAKRGHTTEIDQEIINQLENNPKERVENIMIVDLARNDLAPFAEKNSLKVDELCKIYTFETVHQMISTISCTLKEDVVYPIEVLFKTFPMASMTGVPKKRALEIIDNIENHKRGLYSGTIGYITPEQNFDWNVVIRTLQYNQENNYLSLSVGSAITNDANAKDEYNECLLKAQAIEKLLKLNNE